MSGVSLAVIAGGFLMAFAGLRNAGLVDTMRALLRGQLPASRDSAIGGERVAVAKWIDGVLANAGKAMNSAGAAIAGGITNYTSTKYKLGPVKAHVALAADTLGPKYGIKTIGGVRGDPLPDHPSGLALDFMVDNIPEGFGVGQSLSADLVANWQKYRVKYVIWNKQVIYPADSRGWHHYSGAMGTPSTDHTNHVHVTFLP